MVNGYSVNDLCLEPVRTSCSFWSSRSYCSVAEAILFTVDRVGHRLGKNIGANWRNNADRKDQNHPETEMTTQLPPAAILNHLPGSRPLDWPGTLYNAPGLFCILLRYGRRILIGHILTPARNYVFLNYYIILILIF